MADDHSLNGVVDSTLYLLLLYWDLIPDTAVWGLGPLGNKFVPPYLDLIHLVQLVMEKPTTRSEGGGMGSSADRKHSPVSELEAGKRKLDEWWETVLKINIQIEPLELRIKFQEVVSDSRKAQRQVCLELE